MFLTIFDRCCVDTSKKICLICYQKVQLYFLNFRFIELLLAQNYNCAADYIDVAFKCIDQFIDKKMAESHAESVNKSKK